MGRQVDRGIARAIEEAALGVRPIHDLGDVAPIDLSIGKSFERSQICLLLLGQWLKSSPLRRVSFRTFSLIEPAGSLWGLDRNRRTLGSFGTSRFGRYPAIDPTVLCTNGFRK